VFSECGCLNAYEISEVPGEKFVEGDALPARSRFNGDELKLWQAHGATRQPCKCGRTDAFSPSASSIASYDHTVMAIMATACHDT
jgi:hypothetical protein